MAMTGRTHRLNDDFRWAMSGMSCVVGPFMFFIALIDQIASKGTLALSTAGAAAFCFGQGT